MDNYENIDMEGQPNNEVNANQTEQSKPNDLYKEVLIRI